MNAPLRLLYVSHSFPPPDEPLKNVGGMQRVATELYETLRGRDGVRLSSMLLHASWRMNRLLTGPFLAGLLYRIPRRVEREEIDVVLFSSMVTASLAVLLTRLLDSDRPALVGIAHGKDVTLPFGPYQWLLDRVFAHLDAVFPVSRATGQACREHGCPPDRIRVIPNGVNPERFEHGRAGPTRAFRYSNGTPDSESTLALCSVGRQVERKGYLWFVEEVMPRLPERVHYWLGGDGPQHEEIETAARSRGVTDRVHLLGRISEPDLESLYRSSDLFVMPNIPIDGDMEGFGVVMLEAGLCGLPVIASRLEGIQDVVQEGENGHLVEPRNAEAFVEAVRPYLEDPPSLEAASERAKRYTLEHFTWNRITDQYVDALRNVATQPVPR